MNVWLIAEREFQAYVGAASFWIALVIAPLAMVAALALTGAASVRPAPIGVRIVAADPDLARSAARALADAADADAMRLTILKPGQAGPAVWVGISRRGGVVEARLPDALPLSGPARSLFARTLERDEADRHLVTPTPRARVIVDAPAGPKPDTRAAARFATVIMLWLTLAGSLGMLLQAVVRERANRSLECLLAAAGPAEIVLGKLAGVGAVSILVLSAWLGAAGAIAPLAPSGAGLVKDLLLDLADPVSLARAGVVYIIGYAFYGFITIALGAAARDSAAAQNLVRPMFAVLLAAFFATLASAAGGGAHLDWLVWLPPFTPFMLLLRPMGQDWIRADLLALAPLVAATAIAGAWAVSGLTLTPQSPWRRRKSAPRAAAA